MSGSAVMEIEPTQDEASAILGIALKKALEARRLIMEGLLDEARVVMIECVEALESPLDINSQAGMESRPWLNPGAECYLLAEFAVAIQDRDMAVLADLEAEHPEIEKAKR